MRTGNLFFLRLVQLKQSEEWAAASDGLTFIFPEQGISIRRVSGRIPTQLVPGDVLVANGTTRTKLFATNGEPAGFWFFRVSLVQLFPLFEARQIPLLLSVTETLKTTRFYPARTSVAIECHRLLPRAQGQSILEHRSRLLGVAGAVLSAELQNARTERTGFVAQEEQMGRVLDRMSAAEFLELSIPELAARFCCSRRHLNRLFHKYFGLSVAALKQEMRMIRAVSLLRNPSAKIIHVAEDCGFNYLGLFNTCFKRRFGMNPSHWRKTMLSAEGASGDGARENLQRQCRLQMAGLCPWKNETGDFQSPPKSAPLGRSTGHPPLTITFLPGQDLSHFQ